MQKYHARIRELFEDLTIYDWHRWKEKEKEKRKKKIFLCTPIKKKKQLIRKKAFN